MEHTGDFMELQSLEKLKKQHQPGEAQVELVLQQLLLSGKYLSAALSDPGEQCSENSPLKMQLLIF